KAVISTPYWHARELLAEDRGILVPFSDPKAISEGVNRFLSDPVLMTTTRRRAWKLGRTMIWSVVARHHMKSFERARASLSEPPRKAFAVQTLDNRPYHLPPLKLDHLFRMTDNTGIFQHAIFNVPSFAQGYCTDDNARAFILTVLLEETTNQVTEQQFERLASIYLAFLWHAFNQETCRFRNFMNHQRQWLEREGSEDSHSRALWATGTALGRSKNDGHRNLSALLFQRGLPVVESFTSPRAWAFALMAIQEYLRAFSGDRTAKRLREVLTNRLVDLYRTNASPDWEWFEPVATYDNAKLSHAMILNGFWTRGSERTRFDQQPLEAHAMISACVEALSLTRDTGWHRAARRCFEWFLGRNDLGQPLYDSRSGGCRDALHVDRVNQNQGAESSLAFLLSLAEMNRAEAVLFSDTQKSDTN